MKGVLPIETVNNSNILRTVSVDMIVKKEINPLMINDVEIFRSSILLLCSLLAIGLLLNLVSKEIFLIFKLKFYLYIMYRFK